MTTRFGSRLKKSDNLFIGPLLRGGRVTPNDIVIVLINIQNLEDLLL